MSRFLATTALEEFWDKSANLVFLGEWCLRYTRRHENVKLSAILARDPLDSRLQTDRAVDIVSALYERFLPQLANALNLLHDKQYSTRYWRILVGPWLQFYVSVLYDRYSYIKAAVEDHPGISTLGLSESDFVTPVDTLDFMSRIYGDLYNLQLYTRILVAMGVEVPRKSLPAKSERRSAPLPRRSARSITKIAARRLINTVIRTLCGSRAIILKSSYFPRALLIRLAFASRLRALPSFVLPIQLHSSEPDSRRRSEILMFFQPSDDFERLLTRLLPDDLPQCFVENYRDIESYSRKQYPAKPLAIFSANDWYYDEAFKQWAANSAEAGIPLLGSQHGGSYGLRTYLPAEEHEVAVTDRYYSWGWSRKDCHAQVVPSSAGKLMQKSKIGANNCRNGILYVFTCPTSYLFAFPFTKHYWLEYLEWQFRFANALPAEMQKVTRVRPYREDVGWQVAERWRDQMPQVKIESWEVPFLSSIENCRLYVCDIMLTTCLEALAANKPSIMFWNRDSDPMRTEAEPFLDDLRAAGILFDSPELAAEAAARVYPDVEAWWNDPALQTARRRFCDRFARTSPSAFDEWVSELGAVAKSGRQSRV